jgi:hypothetical protein
VQQKLAAICPDLDVRVIDAGDDAARPATDPGTAAVRCIGRALADVPPQRVAGAIAMITDGQVHDVPPADKRPSLAAAPCAARRPARARATAAS